jgi:hypothetical protein
MSQASEEALKLGTAATQAAHVVRENVRKMTVADFRVAVLLVSSRGVIAGTAGMNKSFLRAALAETLLQLDNATDDDDDEF